MHRITEHRHPVPVTRLQVLWGAWAILGLLGVGWPALHAPAPTAFFGEVGRTWSTRTVALDLLCLGLAAVAFAVIESRRLGMRWPWIWALLAVPLPGAFVIPLFFLLRERALVRFNRSYGSGEAADDPAGHARDAS
jgi:uncharacterized membrane protein YfcA